MVDKLSGVSELGSVRPVSLAKNINIRIEGVFDQTMKDLFGLEPTAKRAELNDKVKEVEKAIGAMLISSEFSEEVMKRDIEATRLLKELAMKTQFASSSVTEEEVVRVAENFTRVILGLPEQATRDEIRTTIASYLSKSKQ